MDFLNSDVKKAMDEHVFKNLELDYDGKRKFITKLKNSKKTSKIKAIRFVPSLFAGIGALLLAILIIMPQINFDSSNIPINQVNEKDVQNLVLKYKKAQYSIEDPSNVPTGLEIGEEVKEFLTADAFEKQMANRVFALVPDFAKKTNKRIELEEVKLKKVKENDNGTIDYNYLLKLKIADEQSTEVIEKKGQLTITNDDDLLISRDWEEKLKLENGML